MATHTLGTVATNSLTCLKYGASNLDADVATIAEGINDDFLLSNPITGATPGVTRIFPGAFVKQGLLIVPNRGYLKMMPNDVIAIDTNIGFPILIPNYAVTAAGSLWDFV